jgi:predicted NUDIX family phosphoesterase
MQVSPQENIPLVIKTDELILVVKKECLFENGPFQGVQEIDFQNYSSLIKNNQEFLPRSLMEQDFNYKQIIPYLIFTHNNKLFIMQRKAKASETRLANKYSLGIGGHIRQEDMTSDSIVNWAKREFYEEIDYKGNLEIEAIGILNDDSNDVGRVHLGFIFLLKGDSGQIKVKEELKSGELVSFAECELFYEKMETWSQMVFDFLKNR